MNRPTALITGASRGIGRAIAARLLEDGYDVVNFSRGAPAALMPGETFVSVDLADAGRTRQAVAELAAQRQVLYLVNNAGMIQVANIEQVSGQALQDTLAVNLVAPLLLLQGDRKSTSLHSSNSCASRMP